MYRTLLLYIALVLMMMPIIPLSAIGGRGGGGGGGGRGFGDRGGGGIDRSNYRTPTTYRYDNRGLQYYRGYGQNYNRYGGYGGYGSGYYNNYYDPYYYNSYYIPPPTYDQAFPDEAEADALFRQLQRQ